MNSSTIMQQILNFKGLNHGVSTHVLAIYNPIGVYVSY